MYSLRGDGPTNNACDAAGKANMLREAVNAAVIGDFIFELPGETLNVSLSTTIAAWSY